MCGLIAVISKDKSKPIREDEFRRLLDEAQIRGQHATGISYVADGGVIQTSIQKIPACQFVLPLSLKSAIIAIGHCRYSTSSLVWNQPLVRDGVSMIHNGVVTQSPFSEWESLFSFLPMTGNDSEILLNEFVKGRHPLNMKKTSQACIVMTPDYEVHFWRNEQRPLYYVETESNIYVSSTKDILKRSLGFADEIMECEPCVDYSWSYNNDELVSVQIREPEEDLQP